MKTPRRRAAAVTYPVPWRTLAGQSNEAAAPADDWAPTAGDPVQAMAASSGRIAVAYGRWLSTFSAAAASL